MNTYENLSARAINFFQQKPGYHHFVDEVIHDFTGRMVVILNKDAFKEFKKRKDITAQPICAILQRGILLPTKEGRGYKASSRNPQDRNTPKMLCSLLSLDENDDMQVIRGKNEHVINQVSVPVFIIGGPELIFLRKKEVISHKKQLRNRAETE